MQSRHPYGPSEIILDQLSDSKDGLSLSASVAVNEQILEVILTLGNDAILVAC